MSVHTEAFVEQRKWSTFCTRKYSVCSLTNQYTCSPCLPSGLLWYTSLHAM